jgi:hypothetical protein
MSRRPQNEFELEKLIRRKNIFSGNSLGNYLQSIWALEQINIQRSEESARLKPIFDLHWAIRLGIDIYEKSIDQLTIHEALFALGRVLYVNVLLSVNEGPRGEIAKRISASHYQIIAYLRQYHDRLKETEKERKQADEKTSDDFHLFINSDSDGEDEKNIVNSGYESFNSGSSSSFSYNPLPDYQWWDGFGHEEHHHDPLMALVSPSYSSGEVWGYIVNWRLRATVDVIDLAADGIRYVVDKVPHVVGETKEIIDAGVHVAKDVIDQTTNGIHNVVDQLPQVVETGKRAVESGFSVLHQDLSDVGHHIADGAQNCCGDVIHRWSDCCTGIGQGLGDCLSGLGHCLMNCTCGIFDTLDRGFVVVGDCLSGMGDCLSGCGGVICNFRCDCGGGGGGGEICSGSCAGCCAIGVWCSSLCSCCPTYSSDDGGLHQGMHASGLGKTGAMHVSLSTSKLFAPTIGTYLTGAYVLAFAPPVLYNLWHSAVKFIKGGDHKETASRDRRASARDLLMKSSLGAAAFFGGMYIPWGGIHTAINFSIAVTYLSDQISKAWRKKNERDTFGGYPHKPQKYIPGRAALEKLFISSEELEQPGLAGREKVFQKALTAALRNSEVGEEKIKPLGRPQAAFLAAQERLDKVGYMIKSCAEAAFGEKAEVLKTRGLTNGICGLVRSYGGLFGGHYRQTDQHKKLLSAIQGLREGRITETAETLSFQPG